ncbi:hypothetical protein AVEN_105537-2-1, partial [Araneus ventricosus]
CWKTTLLTREARNPCDVCAIPSLSSLVNTRGTHVLNLELDSPEGSLSARFQAEKPKQEVYTSRASLRVIFCTTPRLTQNRRVSHALQHTEGIVPLEAWSNSRIRVIAARLPNSDDELKESKCPVRSKK